MSVKVMSWVWDNSASKGIDRLVLLAIADAADDDGSNAWPSVATIARKCGGVSTRTVQRSIQELINLGELVMDSMGSGRKSSRYRVRMRQGRQPVTPDRKSPLPTSHPRQAVTPEASDSHSRGDAGVTQPVLDPPKNHPETSVAAARLLAKQFEEFWTIYPRHVGKQAALAKFKTAAKKVDPAVILLGAARYRDDPNREDAYTAHPSTWLNQGRWDDDPLPNRESARASAATTPKRPGW